jgi:imidazolonepropionase
MRASLAVINASELVTLKGVGNSSRIDVESLGIIEDGAMLVDRGRISWTGSTTEYKRLSIDKPARIVDATGKLVTPGFVDPHTHAVFAGSREDELEQKISGESYMSILEKGGGILRTIRETRKAPVSELVSQARGRLGQLLRNGVTTVEVKTGYGQNLRSELKLLRTLRQLSRTELIEIVPTFLGLHAIPNGFKKNEDYVKYVIKEILPEIASQEYRPVFSDCFCEEDLFGRNECSRYLTASKRLGLLAKIHADEFADSGGAALASEIGCVSADHLERSSAEGVGMMAKSGVIAVLLPGTAFYSNIKQADARTIFDAGCRVALGTDLCPNSWIESPHFVMSLACNLLRMTPAEALVGFTSSAAKAIGRTDIGRLVKGAVGDFVIHDLPTYGFLPYRIGGSYVRAVFKNGVEVYRVHQTRK